MSRERTRKKIPPRPSHSELKRKAKLRKIETKRMILNRFEGAGLACLIAIEEHDKKRKKNKKNKNKR